MCFRLGYWIFIDAMNYISFCNYSETDRFPVESVSHACMNEHFWLETYMARSHSEMQRSGIELALNSYHFFILQFVQV